MKPDSHDTPVARDKSQTADQAATTPNTDMQAEDAGSTDSATAATRAMKQNSKTQAESERNKA